MAPSRIGAILQTVSLIAVPTNLEQIPVACATDSVGIGIRLHRSHDCGRCDVYLAGLLNDSLKGCADIALPFREQIRGLSMTVNRAAIVEVISLRDFSGAVPTDKISFNILPIRVRADFASLAVPLDVHRFICMCHVSPKVATSDQSIQFKPVLFESPSSKPTRRYATSGREMPAASARIVSSSPSVA